MSYHFSRQLDTTFADAETLVVRQVAENGFEGLTEIDVQATLKKKLGVDFTSYKILGACTANCTLPTRLCRSSHI